MSQDGNLDEMRSWLVRQWSKQPLAAKPGTRFAYANMNYILAGAMLERLTGKTWDELITERIFTPLGLKTAGLGAQSSLGRIDAPTLATSSSRRKRRRFWPVPTATIRP